MKGSPGLRLVENLGLYPDNIFNIILRNSLCHSPMIVTTLNPKTRTLTKAIACVFSSFLNPYALYLGTPYPLQRDHMYIPKSPKPQILSTGNVGLFSLEGPKPKALKPKPSTLSPKPYLEGQGDLHSVGCKVQGLGLRGLGV